MMVDLLSAFFGGPAIPPNPPDGIAPHSFLGYVVVTLVLGIPAGLVASGAFALLMKFQNKSNAKRREKLRKEFHRGRTSMSDNHLS